MANIEVTSNDQSQRSPLQIFFIKLISVVASIALLIFFAISSIKSAIEDSDVLRGGPAFWRTVENSLYKLADQKDLPEAKKAKIIDALRKLSTRYAPYIDALTAPAKKTQ